MNQQMVADDTSQNEKSRSARTITKAKTIKK